MALDCQYQVRARHAGAVIGDADEPPTAAVGDDLDALRARIERVFGELLHHAGRTLDHFAGGDAVDDGFGKLANGHQATQCWRLAATVKRRGRARERSLGVNPAPASPAATL